MKTKIVIITGGSKGIGRALVEKYTKENFKVYSLSRTKMDFHKEVKQINFDLTNTATLQEKLNTIFSEIDLENSNSITLINNAGRLGKISNLENISFIDMKKSIILNTLVPMQLSAVFIQKLAGINIKKTIINITSGAASSAYAGWSVYCSSKASLEMLTKTIALEQQVKNHPVKIIAIRPGVVATNMQKQIRKTPKSDFSEVDKFTNLYTTNSLSLPTEVASKIFNIDIKNTFINGEILDLRTK